MNTWKVITSVEEAIALCEAGLLWLRVDGYAHPAIPQWAEWWRNGDQRQHLGEGAFYILLEE